eukprot:m.114144 g.114144  ORF g.114144 m.114144 type:complete len:1211 (-) comp10830_c0_seq2:61-3693(-)
MPPSAWAFHKGAEIVEDPTAIRNVCILAHVDHGKTTLADALVASNGIISARMSGKLRYLDDREDEQRRGITMKSSAITLLHRHQAKMYCVNLVDSPGHVDFSSEVSTAVRLSDGCLVVVDAVEGVSAQTHVVLRQAWIEQLKPILVLNKVDRLMVERQLDPTEAYHHLQSILAEVNAITSTLFTAELLADEDRKAQEAEADKPAADSGADKDDATNSGSGGDQIFDWAVEDKDDDAIYFEPSRGNVIFASALDGWGFSISTFADVLSKKLKCKPQPLQRCLWGDYYMTKENGKPKLKRGAIPKGKPPLFASAVLSTIWDVYRAVCIDRDKAKIDKITASLGVKLSIRDLQSEDRRAGLRSVLGQWLPLSRCIMAAICDVIPPPLPMHTDRVRTLLTSGGAIHRTPAATQALAAQLEGRDDGVGSRDDGDTNDATPPPITTLAFVSKMVAVDPAMLPVARAPTMSDEQRAEKRAALLARRRADGRDGRHDNDTSGGGLVDDNDDNDDATSHGVSLDAPPPPPAADTTTTTTTTTTTSPQAEDGHGATKHKIPPQPTDPATTDANGAALSVPVAYTRVFSGRLYTGQEIHVLGAQHDATNPGEHAQRAVIGKLFVLMGKELVEIDSAPAGMVVGVLGLGDFIHKSATLASTPHVPSLTPMHFVGAPIVRVALDTKRINDMPALRRGLKLLHQADPGVEVLIQGSGELVLVAAGEVHIERCVRDLQTLFCPGVEFTISKPIIPLRESITVAAAVDRTNEEINSDNVQVVARKHFLLDGLPESATDDTGAVTIQTADKRWSVTVRARPLPAPVTDYLVKNVDAIRAWHAQHRRGPIVRAHHAAAATASVRARADPSDRTTEEEKAVEEQEEEEDDNRVPSPLSDLQTLFAEQGDAWKGTAEKILAFGPRHSGPNLLVSDDPRLAEARLFQSELAAGPAAHTTTTTTTTTTPLSPSPPTRNSNGDAGDDGRNRNTDAAVIWTWLPALSTGFQVMTQTGPLADEPMIGVVFDVVNFSGVLEEDTAAMGGDASTLAPDARSDTGMGGAGSSGRIAGQLISVAKDACKWAFLAQTVQLYTAWYACDLMVSADMLGKVMGVLTRRNAKILSEEMRLGTEIFEVKALVPVTGSFGFAADIRLKSSGHANPQLIFSHWAPIFGDPFWVPSTEEELAHYGEMADAPNPARDLLNDVRKRKGLRVEEKIVEFAEKQRTLGKNK